MTLLTGHSIWDSYLINGVMLFAGRHSGQAEVDPFLECPLLPLSWPIPSADSTPVTWVTELGIPPMLTPTCIFLGKIPASTMVRLSLSHIPGATCKAVGHLGKAMRNPRYW